MKRVSVPFWSGFDAGDDASRGRNRPGRPRCCGVIDLAVATHLFGAGFEAPNRDILGEIDDLAQQHAVAGEAEDVADAVALADRDRLDASIMTVAADQDLDARPAGGDLPDDVAQHAGRWQMAERGPS